MDLRNKKGSFTIFATLAFMAVLIMVSAVLWASGQKAISSSCESLGRLWGRSILAEYDIILKERYGLFGFYGNELLVGEKLDFYAGAAFDRKKYIEYGGAQCFLEGWALTDEDIFRKQIGETVLSGMVPLPQNRPAETEPVADGVTAVNRRITSQWILKGLPSGGRGGGVGITALVQKLKEDFSFSAIVSNTAVDTYIFRFFRDCMDGRELGDTYLRNEIEYILSGKADDEKAFKNVQNTLVALRNGLNLAYLYTCEEKAGAAMAAAEVITPGPAAVVTQAVILETWAYLEAKNDLKILCDGQAVACFKDDSNWALSLENVLASEFSSEYYGDDMTGQEHELSGGKDYVKPPDMSGIEYEDYLRILMGAMPENLKILRAMDLIQINMKYLCCDWFLLEDYYGGLNFSFEVNGKKHEFEEEY